MGKEWVVRTVVHRDTGLRLAISDDLPGLYVHGQSDEELEELVPQAIRALLEASGEKVEGEIVKCDEDDDIPESFSDPVARYAAEPCLAD
jgi:predicted RNase H-like HicB family nuclease